MDILSIFRTFQTQEQCLDYLEQVRWRGEPVCPYCSSKRVGRHTSPDRANQRWQCRECTRAFSVTVGTIFHRTHVPLQKWFLLLGLMLSAKRCASSHQIARDLGIRQPTVWSMMHRARVAMANDQEQERLLHGIVEADETYIDGKPRKANRRDDDLKAQPGQGREEAVVLGAIECDGRVAAAPAASAKGRAVPTYLPCVFDRAGTLLVTDEWSYNQVSREVNHASTNHNVQYVDGLVQTNTIESFWSLLKRAWYGSHHRYSRRSIGLYVSVGCYKYNRRRVKDGFPHVFGLMVGA